VMSHQSNTPVQKDGKDVDRSLGISPKTGLRLCHERNRPYPNTSGESDCESRIKTAVQDSNDTKHALAKPQC